MKELGRAVRSGGAIYMVTGVIQRGLPIILLPIYAQAISSAEYGRIAMLLAAAAVLLAIFSFGLEASVVRETVRLANDPARRHTFLNSVGWFLLIVPLLAAICIWLISVAIDQHAFDQASVLLAALSVAIQTTSTVFAAAVLRAEERLGAYVVLTLTNAIATAVLTIVFLFAVSAGPIGWFAASLLAGIISLAAGLALINHRWTRNVSWFAIRAALLFGLPLLPHTLAHWALNLSDRVIIGVYSGDAAVGVYSIAYQAAAPIMLVLVAAHQGVMPRYPLALEDASMRHRLSRVLTRHVHLGVWLGMAAILVAPPVILGIFPTAYRDATAFVPWIAVGYVCFGLYLIPMDSMTLMLGRTRWVWIPTLIAATINLTLNLTFVPAFGPLAAAVATAAGYATLLAGVVLARRRMNGPRVEYEAAAMIGGAAWVAALTLAALLIFSDQASVGATIGRVFLVGVAGMGLFAWHLRGHAQNGQDRSRDAIQPPILGADDGILLTKSLEGSAR